MLTGEANRPANGTFAYSMAALRQWESSVKLGSAVVGSMSDVATSTLTRRYNGLSAAAHIPDMLRMMNPARDRDRVLARRHGIIGDELKNHSDNQSG